MARPTIEQQKIISARNSAIIDLVLRKGFSQSEVGRQFNVSRATVNQVIKESEQPPTLGYKLLKEYICKKLNEAQKGNDFISFWGLTWRANRGALMDYPMRQDLEEGASCLWDESHPKEFGYAEYPTTKEELEKYENEITKIEDIVLTHKGSIICVIRIGRSFNQDEYRDMQKISVPLTQALNMEDITNLIQYEV